VIDRLIGSHEKRGRKKKKKEEEGTICCGQLSSAA
jgi:hypothetical protein